MSFTAKQLEKKIDQLIEKAETRGENVVHEENGWEDGYYAIEQASAEKPLVIDGFGAIECVEQRGGEGEGDEYWIVFKIGERYFRKNAFWVSWDGVDWEGSIEEVRPEQQTVTVWKAIHEG